MKKVLTLGIVLFILIMCLVKPTMARFLTKGESSTITLKGLVVTSAPKKVETKEVKEVEEVKEAQDSSPTYSLSKGDIIGELVKNLGVVEESINSLVISEDSLVNPSKDELKVVNTDYIIITVNEKEVYFWIEDNSIIYHIENGVLFIVE